MDGGVPAGSSSRHPLACSVVAGRDVLSGSCGGNSGRILWTT